MPPCDIVYEKVSNVEAILENPGEGIDTWVNRRGGTLPSNVENLSMDDGPNKTSYWYGSKAIGNDLDNVLISSGEGIFIETLDGKAGADTMIALGADSIEFYVDNPEDKVIASGSGKAQDKVFSSITYTLGDFIEQLALTGTAAISGFGNTLNNSITGNKGDNLLDGGMGNDTLDGGLGNDVLMGGAGNDTYVFDTQAFQSTGHDIIDNHDTSPGRVDTIHFNATPIQLQFMQEGEDLLIRWSPGWYNTSSVRVRNQFHAEDARSHRIDKIIFSDGNSWDAVQIAQVANANQLPTYVNGTAGPDTDLQGTRWNDVIVAGSGDDMVFGREGNDTIDAGEGDDFIWGGPGSDTIRGGPGNDQYVGVDEIDTVIENFNEGMDTVVADVSHTLGVNFERLVLRGASGSDPIDGTGNSADNTITGNSKDNILNGGGGTDTMLGGGGNDTYIVDDATDVVTEYAGDGTDTIQSSTTWTLGANLENLILTGSGSINGTGNSADNHLSGNTAANTLSAGAGRDILVGGATGSATPPSISSLVVYARGTPVDGGYPIMQVYVGGVMVQQFTVDATSYTAYTVNPANLGMSSDKIDIVFTNDAYRPEIGQDRNLYVQKIVVNGQAWNATDNGVFFDLGSGAAAFDGVNMRLQGEAVYSNGALRFTLADNDTLDGGTGADAMSGGTGNDTYVVDDPGDVVNEMENAGTDLVRSSIAHALGANVEHLVLTGSATINGTGNALDNLLMGNAGNNVLTGGAGNDTLLGGAGDDTLDGGGGGDVLQGEQGNDLYIVDTSGKSLWERANEGVDTVRSSVNFTLPTDFENLILTGAAAISGTGNGGDNTITGNDANNTLTGGAGNDTLLGGAGNDWLEGGAGADINDGGAGTDDYASYSGSDQAVNVNLSLSQASGGHAQDDTLIGIESLRGSNYNDVLVGTSANNSLNGGSGNDTLDGGAGNDWMEGGAGADVINGGEGTSDSAAYSGSDLAVNVNLLLGQASGGHAQGDVLSGIENLRGSNFNDVLVGDAVNNSINGGAGNDVIEGGAGNDWLEGNAGADSINGGDGTGDWVTYGGSDQAVNINLVLNQLSGGHAQGDTLSGVEGLWGSNYDDVLIGDAGNNRFQGYGGNDFIDGGAGIDAVDFYSAPVGATVDLVAGTAIGGYAGTDTLVGIENISGSNVGNDFLYGDAGANSISGNGGNDTLQGRAGNDWMDGGAGNDTLAGGAGNDTLLGQSGNDTFLFFRGDGVDAWMDSDPTPSNLDIARYGADIAHDQIWFRRVGNDLETQIIGTTDKAVVKNWYAGAANHIERFESGNGKVLLDSQVDALVSAMAAFSPPPPGPTSLPPAIQQALAPVLAANWQ